MEEREVPALERARLCIETCLNVREGEKVLVLTDTARRAFADALAEASRRRRASATIWTLPDRQLYKKDPPEEVAAAMRAADVIVVNFEPEFGCQFWHTSAREEATAAGARVGLIFPPASWAISAEEIVETGALTERLAQALEMASTARLTTPAGTELTMELRGRRGFACYSILHDSGATATIPDWGDAEISPVEGSAEGRVVIDGSMTFIGRIAEPIVLTVKGGVVTEVRGGEEADRLRAILADADEGSCNIAEFGIGTVPRGGLTGHKDDKLLGTAHIALGHNLTLGGTVESNVHIDGVMLRPTIILDGRIVMTNGVLDPSFYQQPDLA